MKVVTHLGSAGPSVAAALGGIGTIVVALLWMKLFPSLRNVERLE